MYFVSWLTYVATCCWLQKHKKDLQNAAVQDAQKMLAAMGIKAAMPVPLTVPVAAAPEESKKAKVVLS